MRRGIPLRTPIFVSNTIVAWDCAVLLPWVFPPLTNVPLNRELLADIVGVILLYKYGLPANVRKTGGQAILFPGGKSQEDAEKEFQPYKRKSLLGLGCLIVGFILQIISNFNWQIISNFLN